MNTNISIVIVHWNTPDLLHKQLINLSKHLKFKIIVVDNASTDRFTFQNKFPHITFIQNKINRGFAFACNQGAMLAKGEWLLFLNPDVEIDDSQINELIEYAKKNNIIACSPQPQSNDYKKPVPSALSLLTEFTPFKYVIPAYAGIYLNRFRVKPGMTNSGEYMTLTGGCLLIKTVIFKKLGGFDERFFLWFEDSDLTKRLIDNNYKYGFAPITVKHEGGVSFKKNDKQYNRDIFFNSMNVYAKKHFSKLGASIIRLIEARYSKRCVLPEINGGVSITVPNVSKELLTQFLETNCKSFNDKDEYIVVTSGIGEHDVWDWRQKYPPLRFIPIKKNKGFASTVNIGFRVSTGKYIGTVNDDVVINKNWIDMCVMCCDEKAGSVNPIINKPNGSIESAGIDVLPYGKAIPITEIPKGSHPEFISGSMPFDSQVVSNEMPIQVRYDSSEKCFESDATNAAAVLYTKEALNKTGLFDERFGSYLEDIDLSLRLKRNGYSNVVCTNAAIVHTGQATSSSLGIYKNWLDFKNWNLVIIKNWGLVKILFNFPQIFLERMRNFSGIIKSL